MHDRRIYINHPWAATLFDVPEEKPARRKYVCPECGRPFATVDAEKRHMETKHSSDIRPKEKS